MMLSARPSYFGLRSKIPIVGLIAVLTARVLHAVNAVHHTHDEEAAIIEMILNQVRGWQEQHSIRTGSDMPFVMAAYAQSLDGRMAFLTKEKGGDRLATSSNYPLSGPASRRLTHALRSIHDGILVGGNTLSTDNPRLSNRLYHKGRHHPVPIVLDTHLHHIGALGAKCRCAQNGDHRLIVCCSREAAAKTLEPMDGVHAIFLPCRCTTRGHLDVVDVLHQLAVKCGINTLMVEGGPSVLSSLFGGDTNLVHAVCITVAPKLLRFDDGSEVSGHPCLSPRYGRAPIDLQESSCSPEFILLGGDCILLSRWPQTT